MRTSILRSFLFGAALLTLPTIAANAPPDDASFGFDLLKRVAQEQAQGNVIIAPRNIRSALAAVATGAIGTTRDEIVHQTSRYASIDNTSTDIAKSALHIWVAPSGTLNPAFAAGLPGARVDSTPPEQGAAVINAFVKQHTDGMIDHVIRRAPKTGIVLTTVLAFDGKWYTPFDMHRTRPAVFHTATAGDEHIPFMQRFGHFDYAESDSGQIIQLPYAGSDRLVLTVFLPAQETSVETWLCGMDGVKWERLVASLNGQQGDLQLPKLKSDFEGSLKPELIAMGMERAFTPQAEFTGIVEDTHHHGERLMIEDVRHVTAFDMDERGTKAAAATSVTMVMATVATMQPRKFFHMIVDRPFFLTIGDSANDRILFAGVVRKP